MVQSFSLGARRKKKISLGWLFWKLPVSIFLIWPIKLLGMSCVLSYFKFLLNSFIYFYTDLLICSGLPLGGMFRRIVYVFVQIFNYLNIFGM